jgi:hypothetical protein
MKCKFVLDVDIDTDTIQDQHVGLVRFKERKVGGKKKKVPYFPAGTEYDHPNAAFFVQQGMATPSDKECASVTSDLSPEQLAMLQKRYKRQAAGILKEDYELFDAGVITGYAPDGSYVHGPNWDAYHAEKPEIPQATDTTI